MKNNRTPRRRAREFAVQGLYQWVLAGGEPRDIAQQVAASEGYARGDQQMFERLWQGTIAARPELDGLLARYLDRAPGQTFDVKSQQELHRFQRHTATAFT